MDSIEYEALRRASQMQQNNPSSKAQSAQSRQSTKPAQHNPKHTEFENSPETHKTESSQNATVCNSDTPLLSTLFEDKEKLLILALILILSSEDSQDPALTLALLYLII